MLRTREIIPPLTLHALDGRTVRAWDFKQKKNLVILFLHAGCASCEDYLRRIAADSAAWKENNAVVLVALPGSPSRAATDFLPDNIIVGLDPSGRAANAYVGRDTLAPAGDARLGVFVTDRYGESICNGRLRRATSSRLRPRYARTSSESKWPATNAVLHFGGLMRDKWRAGKK